MLYQLYELQRLAFGPMLATMRLTDDTPFWLRPALAAGEVMARAAAASEPAGHGLDRIVAADLGAPLIVDEVMATPFVRVLGFRAGRAARRRILLGAPHSGYASAVLSPLVAALLPLGDVWVTEWVDARLVPAAAGPFGLAEQQELLTGLAGRCGRGVHLVGLSQSVPVMLAAAAAMADAGQAPGSLVLLGGPVDPRLAPTPLQQTLGLIPRDLLRQQVVARVADRHPGAGREVFPAFCQLLAYASVDPAAYLDIHLGLLAELMTGQANGFARQHADLHRLLDVPAELFLDTVGHAVTTPLAIPAAARLRDVPLLTVEAGRDGLVGPGQTHAAATLTGGAATAATIAGAAHHDLFVGPRFSALVVPELQRFYAALPG